MKGKITILFLFLTSVSFAQNWENITTDVAFTVDKAQIICKSNQGYDYEYTVLKLTNLSNEGIFLNFKVEQWYNDECYNCSGEGDNVSGYHSFKIPANSSIEGDCISGGILRTFHHSITIHPNAYKSVLTDLVVSNVTATKF